MRPEHKKRILHLSMRYPNGTKTVNPLRVSLDILSILPRTLSVAILVNHVKVFRARTCTNRPNRRIENTLEIQ